MRVSRTRKRTTAELLRRGTGSWLRIEVNHRFLDGKTDLAALWRDTGVLLFACATPLEKIDVVHAPSALVPCLLTRAYAPVSRVLADAIWAVLFCGGVYTEEQLDLG